MKANFGVFIELFVLLESVSFKSMGLTFSNISYLKYDVIFNIATKIRSHMSGKICFFTWVQKNVALGIVSFETHG